MRKKLGRFLIILTAICYNAIKIKITFVHVVSDGDVVRFSALSTNFHISTKLNIEFVLLRFSIHWLRATLCLQQFVSVSREIKKRFSIARAWDKRRDGKRESLTVAEVDRMWVNNKSISAPSAQPLWRKNYTIYSRRRRQLSTSIGCESNWRIVRSIVEWKKMIWRLS